MSDSALRKREFRKNETAEQRELRRAYDREYKRKKKCVETMEQREMRLKKGRERMRNKRAMLRALERHNFQNENLNQSETEIVYKKIEDINENITQQEQLEDDIKKEEHIDIDYELFEKKISNCETRPELNHEHYSIENQTKKRPLKCDDEFRNENNENMDMFTPEVVYIKVEDANDQVEDISVFKSENSSEIKNNLVVEASNHTQNKFKCVICKKVFKQRQQLVRHVKTHAKEKPFHCQLCAKEFSKKWNLSSHMKTHTGEKPFKCHICAKTFSFKCNLGKHLKTHKQQNIRNTEPYTQHFNTNLEELPKVLNGNHAKHQNERNENVNVFKTEEVYIKVEDMNDSDR